MADDRRGAGWPCQPLQQLPFLVTEAQWSSHLLLTCTQILARDDLSRETCSALLTTSVDGELVFSVGLYTSWL